MVINITEKQMKELHKVITKHIINTTLQLTNKEIINQLKSFSVTGSLLKDFTPPQLLKTSNFKTKISMGSFQTKGLAAELLERGVFEGSGYPRLVLFKDEPHLKEWAQIVKPELAKGGGFWVGKDGTYFGRPERKWFSNSMKEVGKKLQYELTKNLENELKKYLGGI